MPVPAPKAGPMLLDFARIMAKAHELRECAELAKPAYSIRRVLEKCFPEITATGENLPRGVFEAVTIHEGKPVILWNRAINTGAQRVAIAHGLAHVIFDRTPNGELRCGKTYEDNAPAIERRADLLAGELLAPFADLDRHFEGDLFPRDPVDRRIFDDEVDHASSKFKVPAGFLRWRLYDLAQLRKTHFRVG